MRSSGRRSTFRVVAILAAVAVPLACNVFVTLGRCESNADCPAGSTCDPEGKFCLRASVQPDAEAGPSDTGPDAPIDAPPDVKPPACDPDGEFGTPSIVKGLENLVIFSGRVTTRDESTIIYSAPEDGGTTPDLFYATRPEGGAFSGAQKVSLVNASGVSEFWPTLSNDGKFFFFESDRSATALPDGGYIAERARIWFAKDFPAVPTLQTRFETTPGSLEGAPYLHPLGLRLYFASLGREGFGSFQLYFTELNNDGFASLPVNLGMSDGGVNTDNEENAPVVSFDDLTLYFARGDEVTTLRDIWKATRATPGATGVYVPFGSAKKVVELNTEWEELPVTISNDACRLYFISNRPLAGKDAGDDTTFRVYVAERTKK